MNTKPTPTTDESGGGIITLSEATKMIKISRSNLYKKIDAGLLPKPLKQGSRSYYLKMDILNYIENLERKLLCKTHTR